MTIAMAILSPLSTQPGPYGSSIPRRWQPRGGFASVPELAVCSVIQSLGISSFRSATPIAQHRHFGRVGGEQPPVKVLELGLIARKQSEAIAELRAWDHCRALPTRFAAGPRRPSEDTNRADSRLPGPFRLNPSERSEYLAGSVVDIGCNRRPGEHAEHGQKADQPDPVLPSGPDHHPPLRRGPLLAASRADPQPFGGRWQAPALGPAFQSSDVRPGRAPRAPHVLAPLAGQPVPQRGYQVIMGKLIVRKDEGCSMEDGLESDPVPPISSSILRPPSSVPSGRSA